MPVLSEIKSAISAAIDVYQFIQRYRTADKEIQDLSSDILALTAVLDCIATVCETTQDSTSLDALKRALDSCCACLKTLQRQLPDSVMERNDGVKSKASVFQKTKFAGGQKKGLEDFRRSLLECKATLNLALSKTQLQETTERLKRIQDNMNLNSAEIRQAQDEIQRKLRRIEHHIKAKDADSDVSDTDAQHEGYDGRAEQRRNEDEEADSGHSMKKYRLQMRDRPKDLQASTPAVNDGFLNAQDRAVSLPSMKCVIEVNVLLPGGRSRDVDAGVDGGLNFNWTSNSFVFSKFEASDQIRRIQDVEDDSSYKGKSLNMFKLRYAGTVYEPEGVVRLRVSHGQFNRAPVDFLVFDSLKPPHNITLVICGSQLSLLTRMSSLQQSGSATRTSNYNLNSSGESAKTRPSNSQRYTGDPPGMLPSTSTSNQYQQPVSQGYAGKSQNARSPGTSARIQHQQSGPPRYSASSRSNLPSTATQTQHRQPDAQRYSGNSQGNVLSPSARTESRTLDSGKVPGNSQESLRTSTRPWRQEVDRYSR